MDVNLTRILTKSVDDKYVEQFYSTKQLQDWFVENTDKEGNVTEDIVIFDDAEVKVNSEGRIEMVMSDSTLDRSFERMDQTGWKLKNYKKNPVMLWSHDIRIPAIGIMEKVDVREDEKLKGFPKFDLKDVDAFAWMIGQKIESGTLRAGSVGFRVLKLEVIENEKDPTRYVIREMELYEFSIVNVPALPTALTNWRKDEDEEGKSEIDALKKTVEDYSVKETEREEKIKNVGLQLEVLKAETMEKIDALKSELECKTKELDDLKTEVLSNKSEHVNSLFDKIVNKPVTKEDQQTSGPLPVQQTSGLEGIVSE